MIDLKINVFLSGFLKRAKDLFNVISHGRSLKAKTSRGGLWLGSAASIEQGLRFIRNMILTRLLAPDAFGMMAIVLAISSLFEELTQVGIGSSIIQNPESSNKEYLNGAWWFSFFRGIGICILAYIASPYISEFYDNERLLNLMRVAFLSMIFNGLMSSNAFIAQKQMDFKKWVFIQQGGAVFGIIIAIILAFIVEDVWALVIGFVAEMLAKCVLSYVICPFLPGLKFDKAHLESLFKYARGMFGLPILTFIFLRGDVFVVGKVLPMSALGLYSMAVTLARTPFNTLGGILSRLLSPVFSEVQNNKEKVNRLISIITTTMLYLGVPAVVFMIIFSKEILGVVYSSPYRAVSIPFSIILCSKIVEISGIPIVNFYLMSGRPELHRRFTAIRALIMIALIYLGVKSLGLLGASIVVLMSNLVSYFFQLDRLRKITHFNILNYCNIYFKAMVLSLCVVTIYIPARFLFGGASIMPIISGSIGLLAATVLGMRSVIKTVR